LIEFIPAMKDLISELNDFLAHNQEEFDLVRRSGKRDYIISKLSKKNAEIYASLPETVARQLTLDRDPHGNVQVSLIETEKLLAEMVKNRLDQWSKEGKYNGKFATITHFFGYEGRCAAPSNYDADYCYSLGYTASMLIAAGKTGYMASVRNTTRPASEWIAGGIPITMMMNMERRQGEMKPVIQKALVDLQGAPSGTSKIIGKSGPSIPTTYIPVPSSTLVRRKYVINPAKHCNWNKPAGLKYNNQKNL